VLEGADTRPSCLAFSQDGKTLAVGEWGPFVRLYDVRTKKLQATLDHWCMISRVAFLADGKTLVLSGGIGKDGLPPEAVLRDVATGERRRSIRVPPDSVRLEGESFTAQAFSADGKLWATGSADNSIKLWRLNSQEIAAAGESRYQSSFRVGNSCQQPR
jgi:WD40 repeat protein